MAVRLISNTKRYGGLSSDTKPTDEILFGSSFEELDTGRIFRWDGNTWVSSGAGADDGTLEVLREVLAELRLTRELQAAAVERM